MQFQIPRCFCNLIEIKAKNQRWNLKFKCSDSLFLSFTPDKPSFVRCLDCKHMEFWSFVDSSWYCIFLQFTSCHRLLNLRFVWEFIFLLLFPDSNTTIAQALEEFSEGGQLSNYNTDGVRIRLRQKNFSRNESPVFTHSTVELQPHISS